MPSRHKAKEMKRRVSQRKATHKARLLALTLRSETRMAAATTKAEKGKAKVGSEKVKASGPKDPSNQQRKQARRRRDSLHG